jgi:hypothetical protein
MSNDANIFAGITLLLQIIDRLSVASQMVKTAHREGRDITTSELAILRHNVNTELDALDLLILSKAG